MMKMVIVQLAIVCFMVSGCLANPVAPGGPFSAAFNTNPNLKAEIEFNGRLRIFQNGHYALNVSGDVAERWPNSPGVIYDQPWTYQSVSPARLTPPGPSFLPPGPSSLQPPALAASLPQAEFDSEILPLLMMATAPRTTGPPRATGPTAFPPLPFNFNPRLSGTAYGTTPITSPANQTVMPAPLLGNAYGSSSSSFPISPSAGNATYAWPSPYYPTPSLYQGAAAATPPYYSTAATTTSYPLTPSSGNPYQGAYGNVQAIPPGYMVQSGDTAPSIKYDTVYGQNILQPSGGKPNASAADLLGLQQSATANADQRPGVGTGSSEGATPVLPVGNNNNNNNNMGLFAQSPVETKPMTKRAAATDPEMASPLPLPSGNATHYWRTLTGRLPPQQPSPPPSSTAFPPVQQLPSPLPARRPGVVIRYGGGGGARAENGFGRPAAGTLASGPMGPHQRAAAAANPTDGPVPNWPGMNQYYGGPGMRGRPQRPQGQYRMGHFRNGQGPAYSPRGFNSDDQIQGENSVGVDGHHQQQQSSMDSIPNAAPATTTMGVPPTPAYPQNNEAYPAGEEAPQQQFDWLWPLDQMLQLANLD